MQTEIPRKSTQEVEIDRLLAEEFACDLSFLGQFLRCCGAHAQRLEVAQVVVEPSLGGNGFGDLMVTGAMDGVRFALLIEDKISAAAAVRQAERYNSFAERLRKNGYAAVWTVLVAPGAYRGERYLYDASVDLEEVRQMMGHCDPLRLRFRQGVIDRALEKVDMSGVQQPDQDVWEFKKRHLHALREFGLKLELDLILPELRAEYYDGCSWVERIKEPRLPDRVELRHRCWRTVKNGPGSVDMIFRGRPDEGFGQRLSDHAESDMLVDHFSKAAKSMLNRGWQVSIDVPEMRPGGTYEEEYARLVVAAMARLIDWYQTLPEDLRRD